MRRPLRCAYLRALNATLKTWTPGRVSRVGMADHVPVIFVDGELHRYWFVDEDQLRKALNGAPKH